VEDRGNVEVELAAVVDLPAELGVEITDAIGVTGGAGCLDHSQEIPGTARRRVEGQGLVSGGAFFISRLKDRQRTSSPRSGATASIHRDLNQVNGQPGSNQRVRIVRMRSPPWSRPTAGLRRSNT
jgi:hypothetical protein